MQYAVDGRGRRVLISRLIYVVSLSVSRPDHARSKQSEDLSRVIQPTPVRKGGGFVASALLTAHGRLCQLFNIEGILASVLQ